MQVFEISFYGGAFGYDSTADAVFHSPARYAYRQELTGKGSFACLRPLAAGILALG